MSQSEKRSFLMGASAILLLVSVADLIEGTWGELVLKLLAIGIVLVTLVSAVRADRRAK